MKTDGSFFYNLETRLGKAELAPNDAVTFDIKFVYPSTVRFTYEVKAMGMVQE